MLFRSAEEIMKAASQQQADLIVMGAKGLGALDTDEYRQKALSLGASDFLVKPFTVPKLDKVCETLAKVLAF